MRSLIDLLFTAIEKRLALRIAAGVSVLPKALNEQTGQMLPQQFSLMVGRDGRIAGIGIAADLVTTQTFVADRVWVDVEKQVAVDIAAGKGALSRALESRYGVRAATR